MDRKKVAALILKQLNHEMAASQLRDEIEAADEMASKTRVELSELLKGSFKTGTVLRFETDGRLFEIGKSGCVRERIFEKI